MSSAQMGRDQGWDPLGVSEAMEEAGEQPEAAKCRRPGQAPWDGNLISGLFCLAISQSHHYSLAPVWLHRP